MSIMSIKQTEIGTIQSWKFYVIFFLPTESVIVAHPVQLLGNWKKLRQKHYGFIQSF
jgi:hypothetical protein